VPGAGGELPGLKDPQEQLALHAPPILAETAQHHGITAIEMARASLVGQPVHMLIPLMASTYLVVSMLKLDYAENQRVTLKWSVINSLILLLVSLATGIFPLFVL
jgi:CitMHS family citrate-Mg2+:H+ or citrate-Ca2+:H+ symporter